MEYTSNLYIFYSYIITLPPSLYASFCICVGVCFFWHLAHLWTKKKQEKEEEEREKEKTVYEYYNNIVEVIVIIIIVQRRRVLKIFKMPNFQLALALIFTIHKERDRARTVSVNDI